MASNLQLISGSPLIGSPIVYQVTAGSPVGDVTFQRVKLYVSAGLSTDGVMRRYPLSQPAQKGETVRIDISSALQAVADKYEYTAEPPTYYPYILFSLEACDEYMQNGQNSGDVGVVTNPGGRALMGSFSDLERLRAQQAGRSTTKFSRKPNGQASVEIVTVGETYLRAEPMSMGIATIQNGPRMSQFAIAGEGLHTLSVGSESIKVYAVPDSPDRYWLRFVNGLGVVESVSVASLISEEVNYKVSEYVVARQELFNQVSRGAVVKQNDQERLKLSSGPIDRLWQEWYLHELLPTPQAWIWIDGLWIPCHIVPEETVSGISRADGKLLEVQFTVRLDISGSPFAALAI
jgi:hypothetical protein